MGSKTQGRSRPELSSSFNHSLQLGNPEPTERGGRARRMETRWSGCRAAGWRQECMQSPRHLFVSVFSHSAARESSQGNSQSPRPAPGDDEISRCTSKNPQWEKTNKKTRQRDRVTISPEGRNHCASAISPLPKVKLFVGRCSVPSS